MHNGKYAAEIAHNVSSRNRTVILERCVCKPKNPQEFIRLIFCFRAKVLGVKVTNPAARLRSEE